MTRLNELNPDIPVGAFTVEEAAEALLKAAL
jgi:hypothetical protein